MDVDRVLVGFLRAQRERVLEVVDGLDGEQLRMAVLPSGWTVLGMIEHLGDAERHWFQEVALGETPPHEPVEDAFAYYEEQVARANVVLESTPLSTAPKGQHSPETVDQVPDLRFIVLHMVEETARHLGHLDAARELIDGRVGLGQDAL
ncbi:DUF664 domain-containing protein [Kribbella qitaiheensis]|uniref:DUF664 domain-containing protein n=1 Tax=Kribbella qitaiheensis TaxID=1544730 RepID=A0A7G6WX65_9ACTN|nr:DinB family protein [Kribbella qitaiheensis]QNE18580.1 DUF664 domain-containing protein [Kribbella qitaiheensis]